MTIQKLIDIVTAEKDRRRKLWEEAKAAGDLFEEAKQAGATLGCQDVLIALLTELEKNDD